MPPDWVAKCSFAHIDKEDAVTVFVGIISPEMSGNQFHV